jgi:excisionase family DNA binding protein
MKKNSRRDRFNQGGGSLEPLLPPNKVAEIVGVRPRTVLAWIADGSLPAVKLGLKTIRVSPVALRRWLDERAGK